MNDTFASLILQEIKQGMLKIGIFGAGHLGKIHIQLLKEIESFEIVGFYDIDHTTSEFVQKEFGIKSFNSAVELMNSCEVIDIVTPTLSHFELAKAAIKKSKHIFIEKPLAHAMD